MAIWIDTVISKLPPYLEDQIESVKQLNHLSIPIDVVTGIAILVSKYNKCDLYKIVSDEYTRTFGGSVPDMAVHISYNIAQRKILNNYQMQEYFKLDTMYGGYDEPTFNRMMLAGSILSDDDKMFQVYVKKVLQEGYSDQNVFDIVKTVAIVNSLTKFADYLDYMNVSM